MWGYHNEIIIGGCHNYIYGGQWFDIRWPEALNNGHIDIGTLLLKLF